MFKNYESIHKKQLLATILFFNKKKMENGFRSLRKIIIYIQKELKL